MGREPSAKEFSLALDMLERHAAVWSQRPASKPESEPEMGSLHDAKETEHESHRPRSARPAPPELAALADLCLMLLNLNEFVYVD